MKDKMTADELSNLTDLDKARRMKQIVNGELEYVGEMKATCLVCKRDAIFTGEPDYRFLCPVCDKEDMPENVVIQERIKTCREMYEVHCMEGNWNYNAHMFGMYVGIEFIMSALEGREPTYRLKPERWLYNEDKTTHKALESPTQSS